MKKLSISLIAIAMCCPAIADNVTPNIAPGTNPAACTQPVLGTTSGTSNLEAGWTPNTLNIEWYSDGNKITPTNNAANTCTYDSGITIPGNTMSKTGYTFAGWSVRAGASCEGIECLDLTLAPSSYYYRVFGNGSQGICGGSTSVKSCSDSNVSDLALYEWKATFSYGTVKGISQCAYNQVSNIDGIGTPSGSGGKCWCKVTSIDGVEQSLPWTYHYTWTSSMGSSGANQTCNGDCAESCARYMSGEAYSRTFIYGLRQGVTDCTSITSKNTCYASYNTNEEGTCLWSAGSCYNRTVSDCIVLTDQTRCDGSNGCVWSTSASACYSQQVNDCSVITDEHRCDGSNDCAWSTSASACYSEQVNDCSTITDESRCEQSYEDYDYSCTWNGESCESYYDD